MAKNASSPGRCIGPLLKQAFSRKKLIASTYAGQSRTRNGEKVVKPGLKRYQKMADIHGMYSFPSSIIYNLPVYLTVLFYQLTEFVIRKFPHLSQSAFGGAVNSFLGEKNNAEEEVMVNTLLIICLRIIELF